MPVSPNHLLRLVSAVALGLVAVLIAVLALADARRDEKASLGPGSSVMWIEPVGDGFDWRGPYTVESRSADQVVLNVRGKSRAVETSEVMPLRTWEARERKR